MQEFDKSVSLVLCADVAWIPLVLSVVELGGPVLGLDWEKTLRLTMATEEIVSHLAKTAPWTKITFTLAPGGWHVLAKFSFKADPSDLWAMNLATTSDVSVSGDIDHLGLLLASRMVDDFTLHLSKGTVHLTLRQDRVYPIVLPEKAVHVQAKSELSIAVNPEPALIKAACVRALNLYPAHKIHPTFNSPGKFVDMVGQGDQEVAIALDQVGGLAGMICWNEQLENSVSFFGPYTFTEDDRAASLLTEHLIHCVARTKATGLFSEMVTVALPTEDFESLGHLLLHQKDDTRVRQDCWYRHLREDVGASVWAHPSMESFLEEVYNEHVLMRDIRVTDGHGETMHDRSVFSAHLQPELSKVVLLPMVLGADADECVQQHVATLIEENYTNIFFRLDLAFGWQAILGGVLMENGFVPKLVLPYGGKSDVVVFQYE